MTYYGSVFKYLLLQVDWFSKIVTSSMNWIYLRICKGPTLSNNSDLKIQESVAYKKNPIIKVVTLLHITNIYWNFWYVISILIISSRACTLVSFIFKMIYNYGRGHGTQFLLKESFKFDRLKEIWSINVIKVLSNCPRKNYTSI